ncbi:hypothetical protein, partial [Bradyrhizobium sp. CIR3A]|uniref:hypothetical protein n=1 Tax=Bradyrhizobium sp. CIR3A TaxID=2663838 RepID=UPI001AED76EF
VRENGISVNTNILTRGGGPTAGVFCPSGNTTDGRWDEPGGLAGELSKVGDEMSITRTAPAVKS